MSLLKRLQAKKPTKKEMIASGIALIVIACLVAWWVMK